MAERPCLPALSWVPEKVISSAGPGTSHFPDGWGIRAVLLPESFRGCCSFGAALAAVSPAPDFYELLVLRELAVLRVSRAGWRWQWAYNEVMSRRWTAVWALCAGMALPAHDKHGKKHAPPAAAQLKNPAAGTKAELGKASYERACGACHGNDGKAAAAAKTTPKPPKLADAHMNTLKDGEIYWVITNGIGKTMPGFQAQLSDTERWQIVNYVRALAKGGAAHAH